jgi:hypothetical protein
MEAGADKQELQLAEGKYALLSPFFLMKTQIITEFFTNFKKIRKKT